MFYKLPTIQTKAQAVILANGSFPTHQIPLAILHNNKDNIICCDGAVNNLIQTDLTPKVIIGDCDSLSDENKIRFASRIYKVDEQETNDLTKTIFYCKKQQIDHVIILGATGKREDHTIGNISLLADYVDILNNVSMITDYGVFNIINNSSEFESWIGQQVSLFDINSVPITSQNLKYPINKQTFRKWWQATLNESLSDSFQIAIQGKIIVYRAFE